jgi:hypothetical protein
MYPAHAPCCHLWPARLYHIFSTSYHKQHDLIKKVIEHKMCVLISSTTFVWNISHSKKNWARYDKKCIFIFMSSTSYFCQILMILEFSKQIFEKYSIWNFMEIHPMRVKLFHAEGWMDIQHNFANVLRKIITLLRKSKKLFFSSSENCLKFLMMYILRSMFCVLH